MKKSGIIAVLAFVMFAGIGLVSVAQAQDGKFVAVEIAGTKFWLGGGDVDLRSGLRTAGALTFKVTNKLDADHGFAIDALKVKQVVKPGEEVTISVPMGDLDQALAVYKFYCHLHPGHIGGTLVVIK
jgi:galactokinase